MTPLPPRCARCTHFRGSHIGEDGRCIVERISGPPSPAKSVFGDENPHPGRFVEQCDCKEFV